MHIHQYFLNESIYWICGDITRNICAKVSAKNSERLLFLLVRTIKIINVAAYKSNIVIFIHALCDKLSTRASSIVLNIFFSSFCWWHVDFTFRFRESPLNFQFLFYCIRLWLKYISPSPFFYFQRALNKYKKCQQCGEFSHFNTFKINCHKRDSNSFQLTPSQLITWYNLKESTHNQSTACVKSQWSKK